MRFRSLSTNKRSPFTTAYTLIEILVVLTIIGILFSFGFVNFRDFARRQQLVGAAKTLQGDLRLAQQMALSGNKPSSNCNSLDGIAFGPATAGDVNTYAIIYVCGAYRENFKSVTLPPDIEFEQPVFQAVLFKVLGNGNSIPSGTELGIKLIHAITGKFVTVTVTSGGEIKVN